ncbi:cell division protein FtsA, partial [Kingella kingae]|nr:cell division protein FtsA [Kingella kingae]
FNLPARVGVPYDSGHLSERIRNPRYATAMGLLQAAKQRAKLSGSSAGVAVTRNQKHTDSSNESAYADEEIEQNDSLHLPELDLPEPRPRKANIFSKALKWMRENL